MTDRAKNKLGELGYAPSYGARPLKRVIQKHLQNPLSQKILEGLLKGEQTVSVDWKNQKLEILLENS